MELTPSQKKTVRHQFDSFCKKVLREEARDYAKHIAWLSEHEVSLSELSEEQIERAYTLDEHPSDYALFNVHGFSMTAWPMRWLDCRMKNAIFSFFPIFWI